MEKSVAQPKSAPGAILFLQSHIAKAIFNIKKYNLFETK
jgi:hypothetical protein